jgi:tetratricopeptide (TPR) repeat protein
MPVQEQDPPAKLDQQAKSHYRAGRYSQAAELFSQAALLYQQQAADLLAAEMRNNQCVSLLKANHPQQAREVVQGTSDIFRAAGAKEKLAMSLANEASACSDLGRKEEALDLFSQAAELFQEIGQPDLYLETQKSISALKLRAGDIPGALFSMDKGLQHQKKLNLAQKVLQNLLKIPQKLLHQ